MMMNSFLDFLPRYFLMWPCHGFVPVNQFDWFHMTHTADIPCHIYAARDGSVSDDDVRHLNYSDRPPADQPDQGSVLRIELWHSQRITNPPYGTKCMTFTFFNAILPLVEFGSDQLPFRWIRIRMNRDLDDDWTIFHLFVINFEPKDALLDYIVLNEAPLWELLSQEQPAVSLSGGGVTICNSLVEAFDTPTILLGVAGLLLPVCLVLSFRIVAVLHRLYTGKVSLAPCSHFVIKTAIKRLIDTFALLLGDPEYLVGSFFKPTHKRSRMRITRISLVWWFTFGCLFLSLLYDKFFDNSLLANLIVEPAIALNTFSQIAPVMVALNLSLISFRNSFALRHDFTDQHPDDLRLSQQDEEAFSRLVTTQPERIIQTTFEDFYGQTRRRNVIVNTDNVGCEAVKLTDPLWHRKRYHCYAGYAVKHSELLMLNRRTLAREAFRQLRRLGRGLVEGGLQRRITKPHIDRHHLASMAAFRFEPHEETDLKQLTLGAVKHILLDDALMLAVISLGSLLSLLQTLIFSFLTKKKIHPLDSE